MNEEQNIDRTSEGRSAFLAHGVTGANRPPYPEKTFARDTFKRGFEAERIAAAARDSAESKAYHRLSVRDNAIDRKWAEKLSSTQ